MKMVKVGKIRTCSLIFNMHCVVPENIHTPTMYRKIGDSRGVGGWGSLTQEIPEGTRGEWLDYVVCQTWLFKIVT